VNDLEKWGAATAAPTIFFPTLKFLILFILVVAYEQVIDYAFGLASMKV